MRVTKSYVMKAIWELGLEEYLESLHRHVEQINENRRAASPTVKHGGLTLVDNTVQNSKNRRKS